MSSVGSISSVGGGYVTVGGATMTFEEAVNQFYSDQAKTVEDQFSIAMEESKKQQKEIDALTKMRSKINDILSKNADKKDTDKIDISGLDTQDIDWSFIDDGKTQTMADLYNWDTIDDTKLNEILSNLSSEAKSDMINKVNEAQKSGTSINTKDFIKDAASKEKPTDRQMFQKYYLDNGTISGSLSGDCTKATLTSLADAIQSKTQSLSSQSEQQTMMLNQLVSSRQSIMTAWSTNQQKLDQSMSKMASV